MRNDHFRMYCAQGEFPIVNHTFLNKEKEVSPLSIRQLGYKCGGCRKLIPAFLILRRPRHSYPVQCQLQRCDEIFSDFVSEGVSKIAITIEYIPYSCIHRPWRAIFRQSCDRQTCSRERTHDVYIHIYMYKYIYIDIYARISYVCICVYTHRVASHRIFVCRVHVSTFPETRYTDPGDSYL